MRVLLCLLLGAARICSAQTANPPGVWGPVIIKPVYSQAAVDSAQNASIRTMNTSMAAMLLHGDTYVTVQNTAVVKIPHGLDYKPLIWGAQVIFPAGTGNPAMDADAQYIILTWSTGPLVPIPMKINWHAL